jgi:hypothetical protein
METKGINFSGIPETAIRVLTSPSAFFREMPKTGGFVEPLIFMVVMGIIGGLIHAVLGIIGLGFGMGVGAAVGSIVVVPIAVAVFGFVGAAILFVIWKLMGSQESYETAYRCGAYMSAIVPINAVLGIIPYVGSAIGIILGTFLIVIASVEVHAIPSQKARLVFGIIGAILILASISSQFAARKFSREAVKFQKQMEETSKTMQKQAEEMQKQTEALQKQAEEARKAAEEMQKQMGKK